MKSQRSARKKYLINPTFQWKVIRWLLGLSLLTSMIYFLSNLVFFRHLRALGVQQHLAPDALYFQFLAQQQIQMEMIFVVSTVIAVGLIIGFGIFASHKIAGPIYRMCEHLNHADADRLPELKFREGDFFQELGVSFNQFRDRMKQE